MKDVFVSVIVTCYNASGTVAASLDTLAAQTYKEFEIVIVDDGSEDATAAIIHDWMNFNRTTKCTLLQPGKIGRGCALNHGVKNAAGFWVAICDADDLWHPMKLKLQVEHLCSYPNIDVLATDAILFKVSVLFNEVNEGYATKRFTLNDLLQTNQITHSSVLMRKALAAYNEERVSQLDYSLWLELLEKDKLIEIILLPLTFHRIHSKQFFEGRNGKIYQWRSFTLKATYCFKAGALYALTYNFCKLCYDLILPRSVRLSLRGFFKKKYVR